MHHCLLVPELAARIVEACAQDYRVACLESGYRPHFNTLCALARTCRTLQEPALDVIWYYQFGIQNLVKCMPRTLYQIHRRPDPDESGMYNELSVNMSGDATQVDWERFDFYARRVHRLECSQYYVGRFLMPRSRYYAEADSSVICRMQELKRGPLLPNIQSICWAVRHISRASFPGLKCLLIPTLTSLEFVCQHDKGDKKLLEDFMAALPAYCPHLQRLHLKAPFDVLDFVSLSSVLHEYGALRQFALTIDIGDQRQGDRGDYVVTPSLLSQLTTISNLSELRLVNEPRMFNRSSYAPSKDIVQPSIFRSIKVLCLYFDDVESTIRLWEDFEFPFLRELSVEYGESHPYPAPLRMLSRITASVSCDTLQSITIRCCPHLPRRFSVVAGPLCLHQLVPFCNLRYLVFELSFNPIPLTDADLEEFARARPHLRTLQLINKPEDVTYRGVAALVRLCPDLTTLSIDIAPTPALEPDVLADLPVSTNTVLLVFCNSVQRTGWTSVPSPTNHVHLDHREPVGNVESTAAWVAKMFPRGPPLQRRDRSQEREPYIRWRTWDEVFALADKERKRALVGDAPSDNSLVSDDVPADNVPREGRSKRTSRVLSKLNPFRLGRSPR